MSKSLFASLLLPAALIAGTAGTSFADDVKIVVENRYVKEVPAFKPAAEANIEGVNAIYYEGPEYKGKPTRVFAYYGIPKSKDGGKVPAMVLIHGGGDTAFASWVKQWNDRGYAAIAMDTCGCVPVKAEDGKSWRKIEGDGGPAGWGSSLEHLNDPFQDQWPYYTVNAIARARTLIGSFPEVDGSNVGVSGISWGGYLTCLVAGTDQRYRFAIPVYGCGFLSVKSYWMTPLGKPKYERWNKWFDPSVYLPNAGMPVFWLSGTNDFAYPLEALIKSYGVVKSPVTLRIIMRMPHGYSAGRGPEEIGVFADSFCKGGTSLPSFKEQGVTPDGEAWAVFNSKTALKKAELIFTKETGHWKERKFESVPAKLDASTGRVSAAIPEGALFRYFNITDDRNLTISSPVVEATGK